MHPWEPYFVKWSTSKFVYDFFGCVWFLLLTGGAEIGRLSLCLSKQREVFHQFWKPALNKWLSVVWGLIETKCTQPDNPTQTLFLHWWWYSPINSLFVVKSVTCIITKYWLWTVVCGGLVWFWWYSHGWCDFCFYNPASPSNLHTWELCTTGAVSGGCQGNTVIVTVLCVKVCMKKSGHSVWATWTFATKTRVPSADNENLYCTAIVINSYSENRSVFIACFIVDEACAVFINRLPQLNGVLPGCECLDCMFIFIYPQQHVAFASGWVVMCSSNVYPPFSEVNDEQKKKHCSNNRGGK